MRMHYSRFGYRTLCGMHLSDSRWLCRERSRVTCLRCLSSKACK